MPTPELQKAPSIIGKKMHYISITIFMVILAVIGWNYRSNTSNLLRGSGNTPLVSLPPLTDAQKLEATKAPEGMVYVPEGEYLSGIPSSKKALATIALKSFYIDRLEVTNAEFSEFVKKNPEWQKGSKNREFITGSYLRDFIGPAEFPKEMASYPVVWVSWYLAKIYCEANGKRLPTSAEWEKAARGVDARIYPWGNDFDGSKANFCDKNCPLGFRDNRFDDGYASLSPVGSYPRGASPFPYGALDMSGNAAEWVNDWFDPKARSIVVGGTHDPKGAASGQRKIVRGLSFQASELFAGTAIYLFSAEPPVDSLPDVGFRCAADIKDAK